MAAQQVGLRGLVSSLLTTASAQAFGEFLTAGVGSVAMGATFALIAEISGEVSASEMVAEGTRARIGERVYRVFGNQAPMLGRYWSPLDPRTVHDYRKVAGLPSDIVNGLPRNSGQMLAIGELVDTASMEVGPAKPLHGNPGGLVEYFIPDPQRQVRVTGVLALSPPL